MTLAPLSIEQFQRRFIQENCPFWFAYNAGNKRELVGKFRNDEPDYEGDDLLEYSWMQFIELVENYPFGHIKVECKSSPQANATKSPTVYVKWGQANGTMQNQSMAMGNMMGGNNMMAGQWGMMQYMLNMQNQHFEQMRQLNNEAQRLNFENQQLADQLEAEGEPNFKEKMIMEGIGAVKDLLRPALSLHPQVGSLGTMGQRTESKPEAQPQNQKRPRSLDQIMHHLTVIDQSLPDYHINDVVMALAAFVQSNPAQAAGLIGPLIQQLHAQQQQG